MIFPFFSLYVYLLIRWVKFRSISVDSVVCDPKFITISANTFLHMVKKKKNFVALF